ncbi:MAG TPA: TetR family transcriptional regulator [Pseudonocardiaceae bacterium]|jgi:AcrR family transcriptional regulator|nr:TetR family transcriptional regulator [Pseudonocardiaceae bacterium]
MTESTSTGRGRGRRGGGEDTKAALLAAAKAVFAEQGYDNATVRTIAARAGVDPAMVNHWFGGKQGLFAAAVLQLPITPADLLAHLLDGDPNTVAERMVRIFVTVWDTEGGATLAALIRSVTNQPSAAEALRTIFVDQVFGPLVAALHTDPAPLRANLCASQMVGLGMVRYVLRFEPMATTEVDELVTAIAPTLQRYLTGDLGLDD